MKFCRLRTSSRTSKKRRHRKSVFPARGWNPKTLPYLTTFDGMICVGLGWISQVHGPSSVYIENSLKISLWIKAMELSQIINVPRDLQRLQPCFCPGHLGLSTDLCTRGIMSMRKRFRRFRNRLHAVLEPHRANRHMLRLQRREGDSIEETSHWKYIVIHLKW